RHPERARAGGRVPQQRLVAEVQAVEGADAGHAALRAQGPAIDVAEQPVHGTFPYTGGTAAPPTRRSGAPAAINAADPTAGCPATTAPRRTPRPRRRPPPAAATPAPTTARWSTHPTPTGSPAPPPPSPSPPAAAGAGSAPIRVAPRTPLRAAGTTTAGRH